MIIGSASSGKRPTSLTKANAGPNLRKPQNKRDRSSDMPRNLVSHSWFERPLTLALEAQMNGLIYLIGLIVVIMAILSFFGLR